MTRLVSVLYAVADRAGARVELVSAGAMPPLLVAAAGKSRLLDVPPRPILGSQTEHDQGDGLDPQCSAATVTAELPRGTTLLLYTDGLIERRGEVIDVGLARLLSVAAPLAGSDLYASLREVAGQLREPAGDDDVTALALRLQ
jgi:serine phosphatase RsbU (regulator of sigma subunit)